MTPSPNTWRSRLEAGDVLIGVFCKTTAPEFIEVIGHAGFDFCILDMEHGPIHLETLQNLVRAAEVSGVMPIVRTRDCSADFLAWCRGKTTKRFTVTGKNITDTSRPYADWPTARLDALPPATDSVLYCCRTYEFT